MTATLPDTASPAPSPSELMPARDLASDFAIIRALARRKKAIAADPRHSGRERLWRDLNGLRRVRPLVWINEIPWHELTAADPEALTLRCHDPFLRSIEGSLRRELYQWHHFPADMIIDPVLWCDLVGGPNGVYADYGLQPNEVRREGAHDVQFEPVIHSLADVERIRTPRVWVDREETERRRLLLEEAVQGEIQVRVRGITTQWHTPWDMAVRWYGVERLMFDLIDNPGLVAAVCGRMCTIAGEVLDRQQALGMLDVGSGNWRVGSGGLGCCDDLPTAVEGRAAGTLDQWGCGNAQIFSEVSANMHEEFSLRFERPMMERFGLSYYGCCEPLHRKIGMLRSIRNLRKISISPRANLRQAAESAAGDFVLSFKPNPAHLAGDAFDPGFVRGYLRQSLTDLRNAPVEIILKDISTVRGDAARIDSWIRVAMEVAEGAN